jgi:histidinol-phosphate phosphatase family protein
MDLKKSKRQLFMIDNNWTLFLDRDGVLNEKMENDYVKKWDEFFFKSNVLIALSKLSILFKRIIIVTNQRGIGKGKMMEEDLILIHENMVREININSGRIDKIYFCSDVNENSFYRKPNIGMGIKAKQDFPDLDFEKSIMVGDSFSDLEFGKKLGMITVLIRSESTPEFMKDGFIFDSLYEFSMKLNLQ